MRVSFEELKSEIKRVFMKYGMSEEKADICAQIHTESTYDGIYSHGINRVARFADYLKKGWVKADAEPTLEKDLGAIQIYNGNLGPGVLNAIFGADKAMELADKYGIGMVGLKNTTHWMRGGSYGLKVARKGYAAIMWTNTEACMPPWGAKECKLGNNPFVMAVPNPENIKMPLIMDMAISQYSYGKLQVTRLAGKKLPFPGGFDKDGKITDDPGAIEETMRILPIGYWKGSAFSFMLDVMASVLTDGIGAVDMNASTKGSCGGCSQVMIVINVNKTMETQKMSDTIRRAVEYIKSAERAENSGSVRAPGEGCEKFHAEHDEKGIFVDDDVWKEVKNL